MLQVFLWSPGGARQKPHSRRAGMHLKRHPSRRLRACIQGFDLRGGKPMKAAFGLFVITLHAKQRWVKYLKCLLPDGQNGCAAHKKREDAYSLFPLLCSDAFLSLVSQPKPVNACSIFRQTFAAAQRRCAPVRLIRRIRTASFNRPRSAGKGFTGSHTGGLPAPAFQKFLLQILRRITNCPLLF